MKYIITISMLIMLLTSTPTSLTSFREEKRCPLPPALQEHTYTLCKEYEVPYEVVLKVMYLESRFQIDIEDNINKNGSIDRGIMQINSCNWDWLRQEQELDINEPEQNIECGIYMLSILWKKYPPEQAVMAYNFGKRGMEKFIKQGTVSKYAQFVLETDLEELWEFL